MDLKYLLILVFTTFHTHCSNATYYDSDDDNSRKDFIQRIEGFLGEKLLNVNALIEAGESFGASLHRNFLSITDPICQIMFQFNKTESFRMAEIQKYISSQKDYIDDPSTKNNLLQTFTELNSCFEVFKNSIYDHVSQDIKGLVNEVLHVSSHLRDFIDKSYQDKLNIAGTIFSSYKNNENDILQLIPVYVNALDKYQKGDDNNQIPKEVLDAEQLTVLEANHKVKNEAKATENIQRLPMPQDYDDKDSKSNEREVDADNDPTGSCRKGWTYYNATKSCFKKLPNLVYWLEAVELCEREGAFLASILNEDENKFASDLTRIENEDIGLIGQVWLGGKRDPRNRAFWYWMG
ncbi:hypothetical protein WR25_13947 isoform C [Diploscapter pachys]|uniref:C-type lectin domain-containing protein n=1 Tax=Diploscapter pachys TaxID=2018661 RepID=A0A2A2J8R4_9BILA|nr:hypothetical protein WR25_13947 isoform B [Diploscapter pachys]PAV58002.1 hypothetical protein WR25_13947 isoform C [Diploscapter pachys]